MCALMVVASSGHALAQMRGDTVLIEGAGQQISLTDVRGALLRAGPEERASILSSKTQLASLVQDLFIRRVLAQEAKRHGLNQGPEASALQQQVVDAALSDLQLQSIDAVSVPTPAQLTERSMALYQKNLKSYEVPDQFNASHILIKYGANNDDARVRANDVLTKVNAGGDFAELAKQYSEDQGSAAMGGSLGYFAEGRVVPPFAEALKTMQPGQISGLVETPFGYHIIRLNSTRPAGPQPFDEVRRPLDAQVRTEALQQGRRSAVQRLVGDALMKGDVLDQLVEQEKAAAKTAAQPAPATPAAASTQDQRSDK